MIDIIKTLPVAKKDVISEKTGNDVLYEIFELEKL
jgi:hypothetical protein